MTTDQGTPSCGAMTLSLLASVQSNAQSITQLNEDSPARETGAVVSRSRESGVLYGR